VPHSLRLYSATYIAASHSILCTLPPCKLPLHKSFDVPTSIWSWVQIAPVFLFQMWVSQLLLPLSSLISLKSRSFIITKSGLNPSDDQHEGDIAKSRDMVVPSGSLRSSIIKELLWNFNMYIRCGWMADRQVKCRSYLCSLWMLHEVGQLYNQIEK